MAAKSASPAAFQILEELGVADLPKDWNIVRVESLLCDDCGIAVGVMYPGDHDTAGIPLIRAGDLSGSRINQKPEFRITTDKHLEYRRTELAGGELLISLVGDVGRCALVPPQMAGWNVARAIAVLRFNSPPDAAFVRACLMSSPLQHLMQAWSTTTVQATLNLKEIRQIPLPWPPKKQRDAIAHILGTLDDKIELNRRMNETLEAMTRALFKSWFVDFDPVRAKAEGRDPGLPKPLADLFADSFKDSELGEIPMGWEVGTLGDIADHPRRGVQANEMEPTTPYIALEHMPRRCIALSEWGAADGLESNKFKFKKGEILFGKLRPYFHKVGVAPVDGVCSTDIVVVTPRAAEWFGFVLGHISSDTFVENTNAGSTGTKMPRTSWSEMARYRVVVPPESVTKAFTFQTRHAVDHIIASIHESRTLAALRDTLLPKLISGELQVPEGTFKLGRRA
jgi:type I restriction enzyme, S subunit